MRPCPLCECPVEGDLRGPLCGWCWGQFTESTEATRFFAILDGCELEQVATPEVEASLDAVVMGYIARIQADPEAAVSALLARLLFPSEDAELVEIVRAPGQVVH